MQLQSSALIKFASAITFNLLLCCVGASAASISPILSNRVEISGPAADALVQSAVKLIQAGVSISALKAYSVSYGPGDGGYIVALTAPSGRQARYAVSAQNVRSTSSEAPQTRSMSGEFLSALYQADAAWSSTTSGQQHGLKTVGVTIAHPFSNAPSVYWVYFAPPTPSHAGLTLGCDVSRGYSVDLNIGKVTAFKPVC